MGLLRGDVYEKCNATGHKIIRWDLGSSAREGTRVVTGKQGT